MQNSNMADWSEFDRTFWTYGMASLAISKAEYLLSKSNELGLSVENIREINREYKVTQVYQMHYFDMLMKMGIPSWMLSRHLLVDKDDK